MTTIYQLLSPDVEIEISLSIRYYNGIDSDPRVIRREPTLPEIFRAAELIRPGGKLTITTRPSLDYPEIDKRPLRSKTEDRRQD